jgi:hypothetical protein
MSAELMRDSGTPISLGSSQARALIWTMIRGGKGPRASTPGAVCKPVKTLVEEALSPLAYDLPWEFEPPGNLVIADLLGCQQHDFGADDTAIR